MEVNTCITLLSEKRQGALIRAGAFSRIKTVCLTEVTISLPFSFLWAHRQT